MGQFFYGSLSMPGEGFERLSRYWGGDGACYHGKRVKPEPGSRLVVVLLDSFLFFLAPTTFPVLVEVPWEVSSVAPIAVDERAFVAHRSDDVPTP